MNYTIEEINHIIYNNRTINGVVKNFTPKMTLRELNLLSEIGNQMKFIDKLVNNGYSIIIDKEKLDLNLSDVELYPEQLESIKISSRNFNDVELKLLHKKNIPQHIEEENKHSYKTPKYSTFGEYLYKEYGQYVDKSGMEKEWKDGEDFEYKKELAKENIYNNKELQINILNNDKDLVLKLSELFEEQNGINIGDEYDFQKAYVEKYVEENADMDDEESVVEETATALEYLNDNYNLDNDLAEEYRNKNHNYLYKIDVGTYNL